jgi:hypothetical protein
VEKSIKPRKNIHPEKSGEKEKLRHTEKQEKVQHYGAALFLKSTNTNS